MHLQWIVHHPNGDWHWTFISLFVLQHFSLLQYTGDSSFYDLQMPLFGICGATTLLFVFFCLGQMFHTKLTDVGSIVYETEWHCYSRNTRRFVLLMIMRSQQAFYLSIFGLMPMTLENFAGVSIHGMRGQEDANQLQRFPISSWPVGSLRRTWRWEVSIDFGAGFFSLWNCTNLSTWQPLICIWFEVARESLRDDLCITLSTPNPCKCSLINWIYGGFGFFFIFISSSKLMFAGNEIVPTDHRAILFIFTDIRTQ